MHDFEGMGRSAIIKVVGIGETGCKAVDAMIQAHVGGVEFIIVSTEVQGLNRNCEQSNVQHCTMQIRELDSTVKSEIVNEISIVDRSQIVELLTGADMVFVVSDLDGGEQVASATMIIADVAYEVGALTVGVVTKVSTDENRLGSETNVGKLKKVTDSLIIVNSDPVAGNKTKYINSPDEILWQSIRSITDLITLDSFIAIDFANVKQVFAVGGGIAKVGMGIAEGKRRAKMAADQAISGLLDGDVDLLAVKGVLVNISGSINLTMEEFGEAAHIVQEKVHEDADIFIGLVDDEEMGDRVKITAIATGFGDSFEKDNCHLKHLKNDAAKRIGSKVDLDVLTINRNQQRDATLSLRTHSSEEDELYELDVPTFLRKRID